MATHKHITYRNANQKMAPSKFSNSDYPLTKHETISKVHVSAMATNLAKPDESPYYIGFEKVRGDGYDEICNPNGIIQLGLSENTLSLDLLKDWLTKNLNDSLCQGSNDGLNIKKIAPYQPFDGTKDLKQVMAGFMSEVMGKTISFNPSQMVLTSGANPAIEILCFSLADPGDAFLIPAPYYPGFNRDMRFRTGVELIPVNAHSSNNFFVTVDALNEAYDEAIKQGKQIKGLLFSNPSNPVGNMFTKQTLYDLLDFATEKNIHIVSDEIYAGSKHGDDEDNFVSMAEIIDSQHVQKDRVHIVYGLSKDLCMPGFRLGVIYTWNDEVLIASKKFTRFCSVPLPIQHLIVSMLSDKDFTRDFMKKNKERLRKRYDLFVEGLEKLGIEYAKGSAGLYCWVNMGKLMSSIDEQGELELWEKLLNVCKISVTPGAACHCGEPGWFRCCFARLSEDDIRVVLQRISRLFLL